MSSTEMAEKRCMKTTFALVAAAVFVGLGPNPSWGDERQPVKIEAAVDHIDFLVGKDLVGRYHFEAGSAKPFLWPLHDASGATVTRDWPLAKALPRGSTDHVHQKSVWLGHGDVIAEGVELKQKVKGVDGVDFWSEARGHGQIVCIHVDVPRVQTDWGSVLTKNEWRTSEGQKILEETRVISFYDFGEARLFVFDIDLVPTSAAVTFGDTKEGYFGVRVNDQIREGAGTGRIENADGKIGEKNCWGQLSSWCDYSGSIDGKTFGVAILDDPANAPPASWHCRGYGLMAANPFGRARSGFPAMKGRSDRLKLSPGKHLTLRYGLLIHPGDAKDGKVAEFFERFKQLKK
jgi:hypothetical protein